MASKSTSKSYLRTLYTRLRGDALSPQCKCDLTTSQPYTFDPASSRTYTLWLSRHFTKLHNTGTNAAPCSTVNYQLPCEIRTTVTMIATMTSKLNPSLSSQFMRISCAALRHVAALHVITDYLLDKTRKRTNERTNQPTNQQTNERTNERTNQRTNEPTNERTNERTNQPTNQRTNKRTNDNNDKVERQKTTTRRPTQNQTHP